jgi:hypothetical protein
VFKDGHGPADYNSGFMLPASLQTPAALVLLAGGVISCFAGYRVFRIVLGIYGFILGALFTSSAMGTEHTVWMIAGSLVGGVVGALILIAAYFVGVALLGAGIGALVASLVWASLGREPGIVGATAFGGAWTIIVGALALAGNRVTLDAAARKNVWLAYPTNPAPGQYWILFVWIALGVVGVIVQLAITGGPKKK